MKRAHGRECKHPRSRWGLQWHDYLRCPTSTTKSYDQIEKLDELRQKGVLTEEEFQTEKAKILSAGPATTAADAPKLYWGMEENGFCMLMHLASLGNFVFPFGGLILQIVMWTTNKHASPVIDAHGKVVLNWFISYIIYVIVSIFLCFIIIGFPLLLALLICDVVYAIMGAVKANNGVLWKYPLSIRFL